MYRWRACPSSHSMPSGQKWIIIIIIHMCRQPIGYGTVRYMFGVPVPTLISISTVSQLPFFQGPPLLSSFSILFVVFQVVHPAIQLFCVYRKV